MPISYQIDETRRRIYTRAEGMVTYGDLYAHMNAEEGSDAAAYCEIFDCTGATTNLTAGDVRALASERKAVARRRKAAPVAVVATTDLFFGLFRMFDMLTESVRPIHVFRSVKEAENWLDEIEKGYFEDR
jgi:hypothetical protein